MKAVDPDIKVGCHDYIDNVLKEAGDLVDWVGQHDYFDVHGELEKTERFDVINRVKETSEKIKGYIKQYQPDRAGKIPFGYTEYNCSGLQDSRTADLFSLLWTSIALGELMLNMDFSLQWDTFTQDEKKGGGHGFIMATEKIPKSQYWAFSGEL